MLNLNSVILRVPVIKFSLLLLSAGILEGLITIFGDGLQSYSELHDVRDNADTALSIQTKGCRYFVSYVDCSKALSSEFTFKYSLRLSM